MGGCGNRGRGGGLVTVFGVGVGVWLLSLERGREENNGAERLVARKTDRAGRTTLWAGAEMPAVVPGLNDGGGVEVFLFQEATKPAFLEGEKA
jgi:hypothetical protein